MIPTTENLDKLKRWGLKHYRVNRQRVQEMMGTATITTEPDLEPRVEKLQIQLVKYKELHMVSWIKIFRKNVQQCFEDNSSSRTDCYGTQT